MGIEIERRFLVADVRSAIEKATGRTGITQGYLSTEASRTVRVRIEDDTATLTVKGRSRGPTRSEFEIPTSVEDAVGMLALCANAPIGKARYRVMHMGRRWEVDVFSGDNEGLVIAEIEMASEGEEVALPPWVGEEVTDDHRYSNARLSVEPFRRWGVGLGSRG